MVKKRKAEEQPKARQYTKMDVRRDKIRTEADMQARVEMDPDLVEEYAEAIRKAGGTWPFPPIRTVRVKADQCHYCYDGAHRLAGADLVGLELIPVEYFEGVVKDARWEALAANKGHGLRRSNADKRRAVVLALKQRTELTDHLIADHCGVHHVTVGTIREELESGGEIHHLDYRIGADGKRYPVPAKPPKQPPIPPAPSIVEEPPTPAPKRNRSPGGMAAHMPTGPEPESFEVDDTPVSEEEAEAVNRILGRAAHPPVGSDQGDEGPPDEGLDPHDADGTPDEADLDEVGLTVPVRLRDVWEEREGFLQLIRDIRTLHSRVRGLATTTGGACLRLPDCMTVQGSADGLHRLVDLDNAIRKLEHAMPHVAACLRCEDSPDKGCKSCFGTGWVSRGRWNGIPELTRQKWLESKGVAK